MKAFALLPALALFTLSGCEKARTLQDSLLQKVRESKAEASASAVAAGPAASEAVRMIDSASYEAFIAQKNRLVIVDFYADWCGPCRVIGPVLEKAVAAHPEVVVLGKVDVDVSRDLAARHNVTSIPDVRIFRDGRQVERIIGFSGEAKVLATIAALAKDVEPAAPEPSQEPSPVPDADSSGPVQGMQPMKKDWMPEGIQRR
ncbi:MAG: thioredoxin [Luteolibacter sp.]